MRERSELETIIEDLTFKKAMSLVPSLVDYKEAVESGDEHRISLTTRHLIDILPRFDKDELKQILRIK